jgi:hypothetical protein
MRLHLGLGSVFVLAACSKIGDPFSDYYGGGNDVEISSLDVTSEEGNLGGGTVTIQGSGLVTIRRS